MSDFLATSLALNKGKFHVLLTIPTEFREPFNGRKPHKRAISRRDLRDAKRRQHDFSAQLYAQLNRYKPDIRDVISDLLGWIGDADDVQGLEDKGRLDETINYHKSLEYGEKPENELAATEAKSRTGAIAWRCSSEG